MKSFGEFLLDKQHTPEFIAPEGVNIERHQTSTGEFEVSTTEEDGAIKIVNLVFTQLRDIEGQELEQPQSFSLNDYLPDVWSFKEGASFMANSEAQYVAFPRGGLELGESMTAVLHEIGHAVTYSLRKANADYEAYLKRANHPQRERDAWAVALLIIRDLAKKGIVAEARWQNQQEMKNFIYTALASYEYGDDKRFTKWKLFNVVDMSEVESVQDVEFHRRLDELEKLLAMH